MLEAPREEAAVFKSVVVSHDGSRCLESTLEWLEPLLGDTGSHVELFGRAGSPSDSELNSRAHLEELAGELRTAGADVEVLPEDYDLSATEHKLVVVHDPDLAIRLLRETTASLFFTPEGVSPHVPKRIVVALDGSKYSEQILPLLVPFARAFKTEIELVRVAPDEPAVSVGSMLSGTNQIPTRTSLLRSMEGAKAFLEEQGIEAITFAADSGSVATRLLETAGKDHADLVAVSTHGHNRVALWLFGSCAEDLIREGKVPVLIRNTRKD
jgi:nucleotide-binding universal stress UspA family protein